jgi:deazaflavin-dependent oxidoreductase (nitroreductase family)
MKAASVCLVENVGRKSGKLRTTPLIYVRDGESLVIVASKGGSSSDPAWWLNLQANPDAEVQVGAERWSVRAREASAEERERLWPKVVEVWPDYESYQANTERNIPVIFLDRREAAAATPAA